MAVKWSSKGEKDTIVGNDEFMILDSEDGFDATKNKRVKFSVVNQSKWKEPVIVASTANIDLSGVDPGSIDGFALGNGNRLLLKNQTTPSQNGIYIAVDADDTSTWVRSSDMNTVGQFEGAVVYVLEGVINTDLTYNQLELVGNVGSSVVSFSLFAPNLVTSFSDSKSYSLGAFVIRNSIVMRATQNIDHSAFVGGEWAHVVNVQEHKNTHKYRVGDFTLGDGNNGSILGALYVCKLATDADDLFSLDDFRPVNAVELFSNRTFSQLVTDNPSVAAYPSSDLDGNPNRYLVRNVSRMQSSIQSFSSSLTYEVGDLVKNGGTTYRCRQQISSPDIFEQADWEVSDGVDAKNTVQVFGEEDLPDPITVDSTSVIPLENGHE